MSETRHFHERDHTPEENIAWLIGDSQESAVEPWIKTFLRATSLTLTLAYLLHLTRSI